MREAKRISQNLKLPKQRSAINEVEKEYIVDNYMLHSDTVIGRKLNRASKTIFNVRMRLGLVKDCASARRSLFSVINSLEFDIAVLVNYIEVTHSDVWREIANTKRKELVQELTKFKKQKKYHDERY